MNRATRPASTLRGMLLLARWRRAGMDEFVGTPQALLNSLAPLLAMPLVGFLLLALRGKLFDAVSNLLLAVVVLLAPLVGSHLVAKWWRRDAKWLRFAVALNWCQWVITAVAMTLMVLAGVAVQAGVSQDVTVGFLALGCLGYAVSVQVVAASAGLALSAGRALGFVLLFNLGAAILVLLPSFVRLLAEATPAVQP